MTRPYTFLAFVIVCSAPIVIAACGDDTESGATSAASGAGAAGATTSTTAGTGGGATSGGGMGGGATSGGGMGGDTGAGGSGGDGGGSGGAGGGNGNQAQKFCMTYETTCGFGGMHYGDMGACIAAFNGFDATHQKCVIDHVGYADSVTSEHCVHATGKGPCA